MRKIFNYLLAVASILMIDSCQCPESINDASSMSAARVSTDKVQPYTDLSVRGDYEIRRGMFYFKNYEAFSSLDKELRSKSPEKRVEFTNAVGFTSLLAIELSIRNALSDVDGQIRCHT